MLSAGPFVCSHCEQGFGDKRQLKIHIKVDHGGLVFGQSVWYACRTCLNALYARSQDLVKHMKGFHRMSVVNSEDYLVRSSEDIVLPCEVCGERSLFSKFCKSHCQTRGKRTRALRTLVKNELNPDSIMLDELREKSIVLNGEFLHYKCPECDVLFDEFGLLEDHFRGMHSVFSCSICSKSFSLLRYLRSHERNVHNVRKRKKSENEKLRKKHAIIDEEGVEKYKCFECDQIMVKLQTLKEHLASIHSSIRKYVCSVCKAAFSAQRRLSEHIKLKHSLYEETAEKALIKSYDQASNGVKIERDDTEILVGDTVMYKCPECDETFEIFDSLIDHLTGVHLKEEPVKVFACTKCDKSYVSKTQLSRHYARSHQVKMVREMDELKKKSEINMDDSTKYKCPQCPSIYSRFDSLRSHLRVHTGEKPFICTECGKSFAVKRRLDRHYSSLHMGIHYQCNVCGRVLTDASNLKVHMRNHTGEKKYVCEVCGKSFTQWSSHYYHTFSHSTERSFQCPLCDLKYFSPKALREHKKIHVAGDLKHFCEICGAEFKLRKNLLTHQKIHTDEKPHVCEYCNARFKIRKYLVQHYKTHTKKEGLLK